MPGASQKPEDVWTRIREIRTTGVCFDAGPYHPMVHTISTPIHGKEKRIFAALSLMGWPEDFAGKKLPVLKKGAAWGSVKMRYDVKHSINIYLSI